MSGVGYVDNNYNTQQTTQSQNVNQNQAAANDAAQKNEDGNTVVAEDQYVGSKETPKTGTYNKNGQKTDVDKDWMESVKAKWKNNTGAFEKMIEGSNKSKGTGNLSMDSKDANYWSDWVYNQLGEQYTVEQAQEMVSDDGYWGVEQTSQRIVDMAKSLSGGDIEKYDELMEAIKKGFGDAADEWGGKMPDITSKTYDAVMEKMQAWKDEATAAASTTGNATATGTKTQTQDAVAATGALEK